MSLVTNSNLPRAGVTQLGYLGIGVSDIAAWRDFACNVLGLQEAGNGPTGSVRFRMDACHHRFELYPTGEDDLLYAGWEVKDSDALQQLAAQVRGLGIRVDEASPEEAAERKVLALIRFSDPDGLPIEVYYGPFLEQRPFNSPRGVAGFKAGDLGLGHIVVTVEDAPATLRFYLDGLGVKLSDYIYVNRGDTRTGLIFTHVNPRHHSLALVPRQKSAASGQSSKRLSHFMLETNEFDDVGITHDLAQTRRLPMGTLGRHTNDHMISFYVTSPSGFNVEFGWGGRLITDETTWNIRHYEATSIWGHGQPRAAAADR